MATPPVTDLSPDDVRAALSRVLASDAFAASARHRELLRYLVERMLGGDIAALRETTLALDVFRRDGATYDSAADPIVRVEMTRLRSRLKQYYATAGRDDPIEIAVPKGGYVPIIAPRVAGALPAAFEPAVDVSVPATDVPAPVAATAPRRFQLPFAPAMLVALAALALSAWALWRTNEPRPPSTVAVIPYAAPSGDRALAQTGEIVSAFMNVALSRMSDVRVIAPTSVADAMRRTHDALEAGKTLAADYVITGTVDRSADGVAIATKLIRTRDRAQVFERTMSAPQDRVVPSQADVVTALLAKLSNEAPRNAVADAFAMPADPVARERWITARVLMSRFTPHGAADAEPLFREVNEREPTFAPAYAYRATALWWGAATRDQTTRHIAASARALAEHAIALDPGQPHALVVMAAIATLVDFDFVRADALYRQAIRLGPSVGGVHQSYAGGLLYMGRFDEALAEVRLARTLDPFNVSARYYEALILGYGRRYDEAEVQCLDALAVDPTNPVVVLNCAQIASRAGAHELAVRRVAQLKPEHASLAIARVIEAEIAARAGDLAGARAIHAKAHKAGPVPATWAYEEATLFLVLGERERALARLDEAFQGGQPTIVGVDPAWEGMRGDHAVRAVLERHAPQIAAVSDRIREARAKTRLAGSGAAPLSPS